MALILFILWYCCDDWIAAQAKYPDLANVPWPVVALVALILGALLGRA